MVLLYHSYRGSTIDVLGKFLTIFDISVRRLIENFFQKNLKKGLTSAPEGYIMGLSQEGKERKDLK